MVQVSEVSHERMRGLGGRLTRNDISGIHGILVLDEAEAIHELDLGDLASAMGRKVGFNIGLGGCGVDDC